MDRASTIDRGRIHLIGVDQPGMPGLAQALAGSGQEVSGSTVGSDPSITWLRERGVRVDSGHSAHRLAIGAQLVVPAPGLDRFHPELVAAIKHGIPRSSRADLLGWLAQGRTVIAVGGDRSSGLAGAMIGWILDRSCLGPTVVLSRRVPQLGGWGLLGDGHHLVCTADDLGAIQPSILIVLDEATASSDHTPVAGADWIFARDLGSPEQPNLSGERLSLEMTDIGWWAADIRQDRAKTRFRVFHNGDYVAEIWLKQPGVAAVWAALATVAACQRLDLPLESITEGLEEFAGVSRGFECRGSYRGVTLLDDDAADPGEVDEAIALARRIHGPRRLWAVVAANLVEQVEVLWPADRVMIVGPLSSISRERSARAMVVAGRDEAIAELDRSLEPGDVLLTLGAGDVGTIADEFIGRLSSDRKAG